MEFPPSGRFPNARLSLSPGLSSPRGPHCQCAGELGTLPGSLVQLPVSGPISGLPSRGGQTGASFRGDGDESGAHPHLRTQFRRGLIHTPRLLSYGRFGLRIPFILRTPTQPVGVQSNVRADSDGFSSRMQARRPPFLPFRRGGTCNQYREGSTARVPAKTVGPVVLPCTTAVEKAP